MGSAAILLVASVVDRAVANATPVKDSPSRARTSMIFIFGIVFFWGRDIALRCPRIRRLPDAVPTSARPAPPSLTLRRAKGAADPPYASSDS